MSEVHVHIIEKASSSFSMEGRGFTEYGQIHNLGVITMVPPEKDSFLDIGDDQFFVYRVVCKADPFGLTDYYVEVQWVGKADEYPPEVYEV